MTDDEKARYDPATMTDNPIINFKTTAQRLGVDPKTLRKWLRLEQCPVAPIPDLKPLKWRAADVDKWARGERG